MPAVGGVDQVGSWCSQPTWFSSEPRWWSTLKSTEPLASAAAPRYRVDLPHQAPISTSTGVRPASEGARPARRAALSSARPRRRA